MRSLTSPVTVDVLRKSRLGDTVNMIRTAIVIHRIGDPPCTFEYLGSGEALHMEGLPMR